MPLLNAIRCILLKIDGLELFFRDDEKELTSKKVLAEVAKWMTRFDCLVVGPGLGRDPFLMVVI